MEKNRIMSKEFIFGQTYKKFAVATVKSKNASTQFEYLNVREG